MAIRLASSTTKSSRVILNKVLARGNIINNNNLYHTKQPLNSSASSALSSSVVSPLNFVDNKTNIQTQTINQSGTSSILNLDDSEKIFAPLTTTKLIRSALNIHAAAFGPMVDFGIWVLRSKMMDVPGLRETILGTIKHSFYEHFCAGENVEEVGKTLNRLNGAGLKGMLVYGVEYAYDNVACDRNLDGFLKTVELTHSVPPSSVSSVIVKNSAICPITLLKRVSDQLRWQYKDPSFKLPWKQDSFQVLADSSPMYHTLVQPEPLTPEEELDLQLGLQRLQTLCQRCQEANVPLLVDAEDTAVQPAIDYLTYVSAMKYNKDNHPTIYNTVQAYLKDAKDRLLIAAKDAEKKGVHLGVKLVRGAYMSSESRLASSLGYDSPVHDSIQDTHDCYNACASIMLDKIAANSASVVLATHNVDSGKMAATKARDLGIGNKNPRLEFGQLYGMSDALSFGLSNAGFQVSKYMPYGPVEMVMPYLLRRAEENRGLLSASTLDRDLMRTELKRRFKNAIFNTNDSSFEQPRA